MMDAVRRAVSPITRRIMSMGARCRVQNVDESSGRQRLQLSALQDEVLSQVEMIGLYGVTSSPLPGALAAVVFPSGARDSGYVVGTDDARYRPRDLQPGETCIYTASGAQILLQADGNIMIAAGGSGSVKIKGTALAVVGNETVSGELIVSGNTLIQGALYVVGGIGSGAGDLVSSVNGHAGAVALAAADVGADPAGAAAAAEAAAQASSLQRASNLSDLASVPTAQANLGLGTAATAALVTVVGTPGLNTNVPSEEAVRNAIAASSGARFQTDTFAVAGTAYALTQPPSGGLTMVYLDGVLQPATQYTVAGSTLTLAGTVDLSAIATVTAVYTY
jgi:phage baseplate assembly protein V